MATKFSLPPSYFHVLPPLDYMYVVVVVVYLQVSSSVKESVDRTTSILSNLHRVHSYLDILSNMSSPRATYGLKNALDQVRGCGHGRG